jgi:hypothetical protein
MSPSERAEIEQELRTDNEAAETLEVLKVLDRQAEAADDGGLGQAAGRLASNLIKTFLGNASTDGPPNGVPVFDSRLLPIPDGVRPATVDTCRLSYRLADLEVDLSLYPISPERFEVIGQVVGGSQSGPLSLQLRTGRNRQSATCDVHGVFRFPEVSVGKHALAVRHEKKTLAVIQLDL